METLKILSLFSGIGAFEKALNKINIPFEVVNYCEVDKYPSKAYSLIHNISEEKNLWDIKKVDIEKVPNFDLLTWGFPCTDISVAGKTEGMKIKCHDCGSSFDITELNNMKCPYCNSKNVVSSTRSGLYFEGLKILLNKKPKYSIIENVKGLTTKKFKNVFEQILKDLEEAGYNNYYKVLNAKDYGIPQNRERVFIVSIRKDIDNKTFSFPEPFDNGLRLKDFLEDEANVPKKYYLKEEKFEKIKEELKNKYQEKNKDINKLVHIMDMPEELGAKYEYGRRIYSENGISPTLLTSNTGTNIVINTNKLIKVYGIKSPSNYKKENYERVIQGNNVYDIEGISATITASGGGLGGHSGLYINEKLAVRKLTPLECFRLMGFEDKDYYILKENGFSDMRLYKMAGNSIVVNVLEEIFKKLFNINSNRSHPLL